MTARLQGRSGGGGSGLLRVGLVGVGKMGLPLASNLLRAGLPLTVFDVRAEPMERLSALGASVVGSAAEVAANADLVGVFVVDDEQVLSVIGGKHGLLEGARAGSIVLIHSTVNPETCRRVETMCSERGVGVLEVTVSGFPDKAASAELTLMIGGPEALVIQCAPYLDAIGSNQFLLGPVGSGAAAKLANNLMYKVAMLGVFEGLNVARANGIPMDRMVEVAMVSSGWSEALRRWHRMGLTHASTPGRWEGGVTLDGDRILSEALAVARSGGFDLPVVAGVLDLVDGRDSKLARHSETDSAGSARGGHAPAAPAPLSKD